MSKNHSVQLRCQFPAPASFDFDLSWYDTNSDGADLYGDIADSRVVLMISKEL